MKDWLIYRVMGRGVWTAVCGKCGWRLNAVKAAARSAVIGHVGRH